MVSGIAVVVVSGGEVISSVDAVDDSDSICVIVSERDSAWGVWSFASLHPTKVKQRITAKNSGNRRFISFTSSQELSESVLGQIPRFADGITGQESVQHCPYPSVSENLSSLDRLSGDDCRSQFVNIAVVFPDLVWHFWYLIMHIP